MALSYLDRQNETAQLSAEWLQSNKLSNIHLALIRRQVRLKRAAGLSKPRGGVELASQLKWGKTRSWEQKVVCSFLKSFLEGKKRLEAEQAPTQTEKQSKCKQHFGSRTKDYIVKLPSATPSVWLWSKNRFFFDMGKLNPNSDSVSYLCDVKKTLPAFILIVLQQQTCTNTTPRHQNRHSEPMKPRGKRYQTIKKC